MSRPRALFAWELGDGLGHVTRMLPLARRLQAAGAVCAFAVRIIDAGAHGLLRRHGFAMLQAPLLEPRSDYSGDLKIGSLGDVLDHVGYTTPTRLAAAVDAWAGLIDCFRPGLLVADYAPTAQLAARGVCPAVAMGDWFTLPPWNLEQFPVIRSTGRRLPEAGLLDTVRTVLSERGRTVPKTLPGIFEAERSCVITLPELDPLAGERTVPPAGPLTPLPEPVFAQAPEQDYFGYLSLGFPATARMLAALARSGLRGELFLRDGDGAALETWRRRGLRVHDTPQDMPEMARRSAFILHHAGAGTVETALALGRPQLLVPRHAEQQTNAVMAGRLGVAVRMAPTGRFGEEHAAQALRHARTGAGLYTAAAAQARDLARRGPFNALEPLARFCLSRLGLPEE